MSNLDHIQLTREQIENLPLIFRKLYSNKITNLEVELKLCKYNSKLQDTIMREGYPVKPISKIQIYKTKVNDKS